MSIKSPLLWIGLALCVVVGVTVLFLGNRSQASSAIGVPVARYDIPPGVVVTKDHFMLEQWSGVQPGTLDQYVTKDEFSPYVGAVTVETVHAGFPLGKAQVVVDGQANARIRRLSLMVQEEGQVVFPLPVEADSAGNFIQTGDYVDLVFSVGSVNTREIDDPPSPPPAIGFSAGPPGMGMEVETGETPVEETPEVTQTQRLPLAKLVVQNVPVLRVEREIVRNTSSGSMGLSGSAQTQASYTEGDVERLYVALDQEQLEIISFILNNGDVRVAAHATVYPERPTEGVTWDDFEDWFFEQREGLEE